MSGKTSLIFERIWPSEPGCYIRVVAALRCMMADSTRIARDQDYEINDPYDDRTTATHLQQRSKILSGKITNVLSVSYADTEIRDALRALEGNNVSNTPNSRRRLHLEVQKEVIDCNGEIVDQFGTVAEVCLLYSVIGFITENPLATETSWVHYFQAQPMLRHYASAIDSCSPRQCSHSGGNIHASDSKARIRDQKAAT